MTTSTEQQQETTTPDNTLQPHHNHLKPCRNRAHSYRHPNAHTSLGGITCHDENIIKAQRSVIFQLVKQVGKNVLMGRDLLYVTFPIQCCEAESALQRFAHSASYVKFLARAAQVVDNPVERMRWVIAFYIAGMHSTCVFMKPLNPILGETFQAQLDSETWVYVEQSSHHPPVTQVLVTGPGYRYYTWVTYSAHFRYNQIQLVHSGYRVVYFDDGTQIEWNNPWDVFHGVFWGTYRQETLGKIRFQDVKNGVYADITLGNVKHYPSDHFQGTMYLSRKKQHEEEEKEGMVGQIKGSWLEYLQIDGDVYWSYALDHEKEAIPRCLDAKYLLPSDSTFREDVLYLEKGDLETAQEKKIGLEEQQRMERKWRIRKTRGGFSFLHPFQKK